MDVQSSDNYENRTKLLKHKPIPTINLPKQIVYIIVENDLANMEDENDRAKIFLRNLFYRRLKSSTVLKYYRMLKPALFPNSSIVPNSLVFDENYRKQQQYRGKSTENIKNLINYVLHTVPITCIYKWPILISCYSGLRINEVCNIQMSHLYMIFNKKPIIPLKRKNNIDWEVLYYPEFENIIQWTINNNIDPYNLYIEQNIDSKLFPYTNQALHQKLKYFYIRATGEKPPMGFGLHAARYYLATQLYNETGKIDIAEKYL